jgi:hypothetical protein
VIVAQIVKKFFSFYGTQRYTGAHHLTPFWTSSVHILFPYFSQMHFNIILSSVVSSTQFSQLRFCRYLLRALYFVFFLVGYLTTLSVTRLYSVEWRDDCWLNKDLEGSGCLLTEILSWHSPAGNEVNHEKYQDNGVTSEIPTEYLEPYLYTSLFGAHPCFVPPS